MYQGVAVSENRITLLICGNIRNNTTRTNTKKYLREAQASRKRSREEDKLQPKIDETLDALNPYNSSSQYFVAITRAVAGMIATDFQPFSIVEDEGFRHL